MKRTKINFDTINKGKYEVIPKEKVHETNLRIKENMKDFLRKLKNIKY
jgi:hypothetical protein